MGGGDSGQMGRADVESLSWPGYAVGSGDPSNPEFEVIVTWGRTRMGFGVSRSGFALYLHHC